MDSVEVLNGTLRVGDRVAVAVSNARYGSGMRAGTVLEIKGKRVKVQVELAGRTYWGGDMPYIKTYEHPEAMVKLGAMQDAL